MLEREPGALRSGAPFAYLAALLQCSQRRRLLRKQGGDRLMAKVPALVPRAGLEAVLVAAGWRWSRRRLPVASA